MSNVVNILGVNIHKVTMEDALKKVKDFLEKDSLHIIYTPNAEIIMSSKRIPELQNILNSANLTIADGAGVVVGSKIQGTPLPERVAGFDLISNMFEDESIKTKRFFLLGAKPETVDKAAQKLRDRGVNICGILNGYFTPSHDESIIELINLKKADILLVALGAPKQEFWIHKNKNKINAKVCIGVGGSFDIIAGVSQRAPKFFCENNLEWLYRLYKEPWRFFRMLDLPRFIVHVVLNKYIGK